MASDGERLAFTSDSQPQDAEVAQDTCAMLPVARGDLARASPDREAVVQLHEASAQTLAALRSLGDRPPEDKQARLAESSAQRLKALIQGMRMRARTDAAVVARRANTKNPLVGLTAQGVETAGDLLTGNKVVKRLRTATCVLNVLQASNFLARAGMQIDQTAKTCQAPHLVGYSVSYKKSACAANAAGIFSSIMWVATYLSLAASQCGATFRQVNIPAVCAGAIQGLYAGLAGVAANANVALGNCILGSDPAVAALETQTDAVWQLSGARRLQALDGPFPPDRNAELATCVLDLTEAATLLAQMGLYIRTASRSCPTWYNVGKAIGKIVAHDLCILDVGAILFTFFEAASFIAVAVSHCAEGINPKALCAGALGSMLAALSGLVYLAAGIDGACVELPELPAPRLIGYQFGNGKARRLSANATSPP